MKINFNDDSKNKEGQNNNNFSNYKNKEDYSPSKKRWIDNEDINSFLQQLDSKFTEKKGNIDEIQKNIDLAVLEINEVLTFENELKELLKTEE